jgi:hypothetical protein
LVTGTKADGTPCGDGLTCYRGYCGGPVPGTVDEVLASCPSAADIESINARLPAGIGFHFDQGTAPLVCRASEGSADLTRSQERAYQALLIMRRLQFDAPLPWTADDLATWFASDVSGIDFRDDIAGSFCCSPGRVINIASSVLDVPDIWGWGDGGMTAANLVPSMVYVGVPLLIYVHEARHVEKMHDCGWQDSSLAYMGAWGVQYHLLTWLADHSDTAFLAPGNALLPRWFYRDEVRHQRSESWFCQP